MPATKERGETVSGYFRKVFQENPRLLEGRSNQELLDRWLKDHPGEKEVPKTVKANLQNIKSILRKELRAKKGGRPSSIAETTTTSNATMSPIASRSATTTTASGSELEELEVKIDDCMSMAKYLDAEGLQDVISHLRRARNLVVWMQGE
jgi:hypothetical protein